jgi:hypothetical protein
VSPETFRAPLFFFTRFRDSLAAVEKCSNDLHFELRNIDLLNHLDSISAFDCFGF